MALPRTTADLTTTRAPFVEAARGRGDLFIFQPVEQYSVRNHACWQSLCKRLDKLWPRYACDMFLAGLDKLKIDASKVPSLVDVNAFLAPLTGFQCRAVAGYVPSYLFFDCLRQRTFPTTITIRANESLDYLPEPDIFHDVAGHVPMQTNPVFADTLQMFGEVAQCAVTRARMARSEDETVARLDSIIRGMARFFWFSVEFGLVKERRAGRRPAKLAVYGSGILSSAEEIRHAVESPDVQRCRFDLQWVIHQGFEIDHLQPLLFYVDSLDHLMHEVQTLKEWVLQGKLDHTAPGEPFTQQEDLRSFLAATTHQI